MKTFGVMLLLTLLMLVSAGGCSKKTAGQVFDSKAFRFSIAFPKDWEMHSYDYRSTPVIAFRPKGKSPKAFRENVNVMVKNFTTRQDFDDCCKSILANFKRAGKSFRLVRAEDISIAGRPGRKMIHSHEGGGQLYKIVSYITFSRDMKVCYIVNCTARLSTFYTYAEQFEKIANTLKIKI